MSFSGGKIMKRLLVVLIAVAFVSGAQAYAHHSFAATYFEDKTAKIEGKLVQFLFRNPHSFVHVEAPDESGQMVRWAVEWGGAGQLGGQGVTRETLKAGDVVTITGNPGRNPADHRLRMVSLRRKSEGFGWGGKPGEVVD
jgi:hypothetical protein